MMQQAVARWPAKYAIGDVQGYVRFTQLARAVLVEVNLAGLPPGPRGFHIHDKAFESKEQLARGCSALGPHFGASDAPHGSVFTGAPRHKGDLINNLWVGADGHARCRFLDDAFRVRELRGKSIVIHAEPDDLGSQGSIEFEPRRNSMGTFAVPRGLSEKYQEADKRAESLKTGNAGQRIACANIDIVK